MNEVGKYYDQEVANNIGVTGAGLIWFLGRDHLSPSYNNNDEIALNPANWREGASRRILDLGSAMGIKEGDKVMDIGTGIGGPGRDIETKFKCEVVGVNLSFGQLRTLRELTDQTPNSNYKDVVNGNIVQLPFKDEIFDDAFSINMFYHVPYPQNAIEEISRTLKSGAIFGLDDWFVTDKIKDNNLEKLRYEWSAPPTGFHNINIIKTLIEKDFEIVKIIDLTYEAGEFLTEERFGKVFDEQLRDKLVESFPKLYKYKGYIPAHAQTAAQQLRDAIMHMGELYRNGEAVYQQIVAKKR